MAYPTRPGFVPPPAPPYGALAPRFGAPAPVAGYPPRPGFPVFPRPGFPGRPPLPGLGARPPGPAATPVLDPASLAVKEDEKKRHSAVDEGGASRQAEHSKELITAFRPIKYFLTIIGQMPFVIRPKKDGTYAFKFNKLSSAVLIYMLMFFISTAVYLTVTVGIISFIMGSVFDYIKPSYTVVVQDRNDQTTSVMLWERYLIRHEMVSMIVVWSWQTVAFAGSLYIVTNSKYYVHYMNYFNRIVQIMDMNMTPGVSTYLFYNNLLSLVVAALLTIGFILGLTTDFTAVTNTASVISNFIMRMFNVEIERNPEYQLQFQILGFVIMVYALFASRANVLQFLFFSQLLKNASRVWNERLRKVLTHDTAPIHHQDPASQQFNRRLEPKLVYKDHLMIVQLYQMTENVFGIILFAYYSLTMISVVMELYQLAALNGFATVDDVNTEGLTGDALAKVQLKQSRKGVTNELDRRQEYEILATAGVSLLLLAQNVFFCYRTTVDAAKAYETAMKGFDILRRHGMMFCRNKTDRNFVLSLSFSFAKNNPLQLSAGGYFAVNKILLVTMASTVVNWAISIYQTKIDQWK